MHEILKIYTDGGARGNPGPAAAAFVVVMGDKMVFKEAKFLGTLTNNEAEYNAVIMALAWLKKNNKTLERVIFFLDSQLVARQLTGFYRVKSDNLKPLVKRIKEITSALGQVKVDYVSIAREKNRLADKLVNLTLDENT